jgi:hypothetical protein
MFLIIQTESQVQKRIATQCRHGSPEKRRPFPSSQPLLLIPISYDIRVQAETRIIEKDSAIHFGGVDLDAVSASDIAYRIIKVQRNMQVSRKMVQCPERNDAKCNTSSDQGRCDRIEGSVASSDDNDLRPIPLLRSGPP